MQYILNCSSRVGHQQLSLPPFVQSPRRCIRVYIAVPWCESRMPCRRCWRGCWKRESHRWWRSGYWLSQTQWLKHCQVSSRHVNSTLLSGSSTCTGHDRFRLVRVESETILCEPPVHGLEAAVECFRGVFLKFDVQLGVVGVLSVVNTKQRYHQGRIQGRIVGMHPPTSPNYIHYTVLKIHIHTQILTQCRVKVVKLGSLTQYICKQV